MVDQLLPGLDARFLPREKREETIAEIRARVLFVEKSLIQVLLLRDGVPQDALTLTIKEALAVLQIKREELRQGWYNVDTQEFLGAELPEEFLRPQ